MKHFSDDGCNRQPEHDEPGFGVHMDENYDPMKDYENHIAQDLTMNQIRMIGMKE